MNLSKLILASVAVRGVYRRFAELSEEEKAQVVEKVKQKLKEKYPETDGEGETAPEETPPETAPAEGETAPVEEETAPAEAETPAPEKADESEAEDESKDDKGDDAGGETEAFPEYADAEDAETDAGDTQLTVEADGADDSNLEGDEFESEDAGFETEDSEEPAVEDEESGEESADIPVAFGAPMGDIADDIVEDVGEIQEEGKVDPSRVLDLFEDMMQMVTLLVLSKSQQEGAPFDEERVARRVAEASIADRVVITAARGQQLRRKDKDMMSDTGGSSKGPGREPDLKPPRDDVRKPFRTKNKPADERDPDTDSDPDLKG